MAKRPSINKSKKPQKVRLGVTAAKQMTTKAYGGEPSEGIDLTDQLDYWKALNWYSLVPETGAFDESLYLYMEANNYSKKEINSIKKAASSGRQHIATMVSISRLIERKAILETASYKWLDDRIKAGIEIGNQIKDEVEIQKISVYDYTKRRASDVIATLDEIADQLWLKEISLKDLNLFNIFATHNVKPNYIQHIQPYYQDIINDMLSFPDDYDKVVIKLLLPYYQKIVESLDSLNQAKPRKARSPEKSQAALQKKQIKVLEKSKASAAKMKYMPEAPALNIKSLDPSGIIGAQFVVLFNHKYKVVTILQALENQSLAVRGNTIINIDEALSGSKRAGRSISSIKTFSTLTKAAIRKSFSQITGSSLQPKNRTSEETLIVRIIK